ncbi:E3 ubiquitin-protein ligase XIAP [Lampris incognitus]|uniref:E3 ubiquitin-protein ligase XIAP n=1 Tax=Lampris incognitus TaxID=2546036 RepID=UPI0024B601AA|nr:E3 ubiquitin-protein ligase XIAP [Lampris incognitus]XP_056143565.1 E3 ubiquitin-protein ligase XIAP [Lampris incognitus]
MADLRQNSDLETDCAVDWSLLNSRLDSFRGSSLAQQLSAERLARAGFYFTGQADRVRCFSCRKTVENWCRGDTPVERHKEVSPSCKFLSCAHRGNFNPGTVATLTNGSSYNEEAEEMEFRLRTGEVVDESTYPMAHHMRNEYTRLQTFASWPSNAPVRPRDLAQAGLYYLGENDGVQCFCCGGMLGGWEEGDTAWGEHSRHYPHCFFILGHDVGNIPSEGNTEEEGGGTDNRQHISTRVSMECFEERLSSFDGVQHPIDHDRLARAGFYSTGAQDKVLCFRCGGGLKGWQPEEDPWEEHAKHYPGCSFLLEEMGQEFVNSVQLKDPRRSSAASSHQNGFSSHAEVLQSAMAQKAIGMGLDPAVVETTILDKISRTGSDYSSMEALIQDCLGKTPESHVARSEEQDEDPLEKLRKLQREKQCKVCMDRDICIVFIPCGHLVTCKECSESLSKCPICCGVIAQKIKTYIA